MTVAQEGDAPEEMAAVAPDEGPSPPGSSGLPAWPGWPYLMVAMAVLAVALSAWRPTPAGVWHDDGVYVLIGRSLAEGEGLRYFGVVGSPPAAKFPPLYPGVLAVLWALFGGVGAVTLVAEILNLTLVAAAAGLMAWTLHVHARLPRGPALVAALLAFTSADLLRPALIPLSEPLFLALLMGGLAAWPGVVSPDRRRLWPAAGLLVLLVLTRTAGVAALAGVGLAAALRAGWRRAALTVTPAAVAMVGWGWWARDRAGEIPEGLRDVLGPYLGWFMEQLLGTPGAFLERLPGHALEVGSRVAVLLLPGLSGAALGLAVVPLAALALVGARRLHTHHPALVWTAVAYLLLLLAWPYTDRRLVAPLHPFTVAMIVAGAVELSGRLRAVPARRVVVGVALLWMGGYGVKTAARIADGWPVAAYRIRADALATGLEALERTAPAGAIVGAPELWAALAFHGGWTVVPSALFAPAADVEGGPIWGSPEEQVALWRRTGVDHLLLEQGGRIHADALDLQEARCPGSVNILARMPPQMLVRIDWEACGEGG